ncbi:NUDIX hydrolase [Actinoplanes aureus]|uniref:NUDIX domain-containing protein n=1 Tax=Actinoplanes aureus TaxID=2792083 RepID=A0A931C4E5_9ACTN|nr:NUDIX domain-containing protein [Actinoplanes aureus]MBG0561182.1 NUDIX domain-containing protein [Actinoplanes aureus]
MDPVYRPAVRVICFDADDRILLLHWEDPTDGSRLWEPPGGGIEPGETPLETARRELAEETGLDPAAIGREFVDVHRETWWKGRRFAGIEQFFTARYGTSRPAVVREGLLEYEQSELLEHAWVSLGDLESLPDRLEPPNLAEVVRVLSS